MNDEETKDYLKFMNLALSRGRALTEIKIFLESHNFSYHKNHNIPPWYSNIKRILCQFGYKI